MRTILLAVARRKFTVLAVVAAITVATATAALAGTGVGGVFNLGVTNAVDAITTLKGVVGGPSLRIDNDNPNAPATALQLLVEPGRPPMSVNSGIKVTNLHADKLDNKDASEFLPIGGKAVDSDKLDGIDSTQLTRAPRFEDVVGSFSADFTSSPKTVCQDTSDYTAPSPQHAIVHVRTSADPSGAFLAYGLRGAFSTDGGATWGETSPQWYVESSGNPGERVVNTYTGHLDLNSGTSYRFGANVHRTGGSGTIGFGWCAVTVEIIDRDPAASPLGAKSAEPLGRREQP